MKLMTKEIKEKAQKQYDEGSDMEQKVVAKFFDAMGDWKWFLMNMHKDEDYCWGIVDGFAVEMGSWLMSELKKVKFKPFNLPVERDLYFKPIKSKDVWDKLNRGEHI